MLRKTCRVCLIVTGRSENIFSTLISNSVVNQSKSDLHTNTTKNIYKPLNFSHATFSQVETQIDVDAISQSVNTKPKIQKVGAVFDIDGVLVRGRKVIDCAKEAINKLNKFKVPLVFLTNGGCETEEQKAYSLSQQTGVEIDPEQVVLSHSPLRILDILHDKHVVVSGQGPVSEIAQICGFSKVSHIDDIDRHFPELDVNDRQKRNRMPVAPEKAFHPVEAILLMGEPVNWEKSLQIIIDLLLTHGIPTKSHTQISPDNMIPVVAVNTDYLWMSEAPNPRVGHGGFLLCLESIFQKLTGKRLEYNTILGKPNIFTYRYTESVLLNVAEKIFGEETKIQTVYMIGDNIDTDIYGANLFNNYLRALKGSDITTNVLRPGSHTRPDRMKSILVRTGVYRSEHGIWGKDVDHLHRDTVSRPELAIPTHICSNVLHAVDTILAEENIT